MKDLLASVSSIEDLAINVERVEPVIPLQAAGAFLKQSLS